MVRIEFIDMKNRYLRRNFLQTGLALGVMAASGPLTWAAQAGDAAPDFALSGVPSPVQLSKLKGQWVYLDFWASWCPPCRQSFGWMNEMHDRYTAQGLRVVAVNVDKQASDAEVFLRQTPARFTVVFDNTGQTPKAYGIKTMPTSMLLNPQGQIVWVHSGFRLDDRSELEQKIKAALKGSAT